MEVNCYEKVLDNIATRHSLVSLINISALFSHTKNLEKKNLSSVFHFCHFSRKIKILSIKCILLLFDL